MTTNFFSPLSFVVVFGSGIRDPGFRMDKNQDPGFGINIPDPQHCDPDTPKKFRDLDGSVSRLSQNCCSTTRATRPWTAIRRRSMSASCSSSSYSDMILTLDR
jgi:hypothetical protein